MYAEELDQCSCAFRAVAIGRGIRIRNDLRLGSQLQCGTIGAGKVHLNVEAFPTTGGIDDRQRIDDRG